MDPGVKNMLADSLSRLLDVDPEAKLQAEKESLAHFASKALMKSARSHRMSGNH